MSTPHLELLKLHAHAGIVDWFIQLIMGADSRLLPMFMVSHGLNTRKLHWVYYALNDGLLVAIIGLGVQWPLGVAIGTIGAALGVVLFFAFLWEAYWKRAKKQVDVGMRQSILAFLILLLPLLLVFLLLRTRAQ